MLIVALMLMLALVLVLMLMLMLMQMAVLRLMVGVCKGQKYRSIVSTSSHQADLHLLVPTSKTLPCSWSRPTPPWFGI
jgi:hypothetical protein